MADNPSPESTGTVTPAGTVEEGDRRQMLTAPPNRIPRKVLVVAVATFAVLGLGGALLDRVLPGPATSTVATPDSGAYPPPPPSPSAGSAPVGSSPAGSVPAGSVPGTGLPDALPASETSLMDMTSVAPVAAPGFSLTDQRGDRVTSTTLAGKVVVLTFFDSTCDDICPVLAAEIAEARADLGPAASGVAFVAVNTDPLRPETSLKVSSAPELAGLSDWYFLTGTLKQLNSVWTDYGIAVEVQRSTSLISHNDLMYFVGPTGLLERRATPFADEGRSATFTLAPATEKSFANGMAQTARSLLGDRP